MTVTRNPRNSFRRFISVVSVRRCRGWGSVGLALLVSTILFGPFAGTVVAAPQTDTPAVTAPLNVSDDSSTGTPGDSNGLTIKLIPDQKAFLGSPATLIDLSKVFTETEIGDEPFQIEVLRSKKDVAEAVVDGHQLRLNWQRKTAKKREVLLRATSASGKTVDTKFYVELWEPDYWKLILTVLGGLGLFLLGMKNLSEGMQAIAGNGLRRMISIVTDNRLMATGVGVLVTMLVQSSSITTVMVVGFVNSGFMTLTQAVGVIMGANIGTTITGWILVLKIGKYGLPLAGAAAFVYLFSKRDRLRYGALALMGLGLVFLGLELMKDGFAIVKELPEFEAWFKAFDAGTYLGVLKCAMVGCVLTFIVQSSSATLGITIGLAQIGVIDFETAAALVLGENIGTTITAWLASFGSNTNAKRAAYFHIVFNILGVAWITAVFHLYLMLVRYVVAGDVNADMTLGVISSAEITAAIAMAHTGFNVTNTIVFLPLAGHIASGLKRVIPDRRRLSDEEEHLTNLDVRMLESPVVAVEQSRVEVLRMVNACKQMMAWLEELHETDGPGKELRKKILDMEEELDVMQGEIVTFMSNLLVGNVPHDVVAESRRQLRLVDEYESISDCIATVVKAHRHLERHDLRLPNAQQQELLELHTMVSDYLGLVSHYYEQLSHAGGAVEALPHGESITKHAKSLYKGVISKPPEEQLEVRSLVSYNRMVAAYRRVRDHLVNIAEALAGEK
ncbi:Na+/Pi-cotransporter [Stieleria neptunia]|uniref:Na+/Pi-cotransporter n=1 Tax=Stieleria neptunia TaxID=2527979 RepID=A0A518HTS0_9BACT|nr:Na+/Pi-cotransporter [Stieleria neptunia]